MLTRREFLKDAALLGAAGCAGPLIACGSSGSTYDTVIRGGTVYDGTATAALPPMSGLSATGLWPSGPI